MKVRAYCSSANLGAGFDVAAVALDAFYDEVDVSVKTGNGRITTEFHGPYSENISLEDNTALLSARLLLTMSNVGVDVDIKIWKGIPLGLGLGGSGATAVATVKALSLELGLKIDDMRVASIAGLSEKVAAGSPHYDNVTASLLGGLIIIYNLNPLKALRFYPKGYFVLGIPHVKTPSHKTEIMRIIAPKTLSLEVLPHSLSRMAAFIAGLYTNSLELIGQSMTDNIIEPIRALMVPAYEKLRKYVKEAGAFGFTISGAGPSVIALTDEEHLKNVMSAMSKAYSEENIKADVISTKPAPPASQV
ncbi:MAG: homoserine kinase [Thermoprotei archaeon]